MAAHVHNGFTPEAVGKAEVSATKSPGTSQVSPVGLAAPSLGVAAIRQVLIWCALPRATPSSGMPVARRRESQDSKSDCVLQLSSPAPLRLNGSTALWAEWISCAPAAARIRSA